MCAAHWNLQEALSAAWQWPMATTLNSVLTQAEKLMGIGHISLRLTSTQCSRLVSYFAAWQQKSNLLLCFTISRIILLTSHNCLWELFLEVPGLLTTTALKLCINPVFFLTFVFSAALDDCPSLQISPRFLCCFTCGETVARKTKNSHLLRPLSLLESLNLCLEKSAAFWMFFLCAYD